MSAFDAYQQTLAKFPDSFVAGKAAGRLAAGLLRYEEARKFLAPLHSRDTTDMEISYYLGLAYDGLGDSTRARASYELAERLPSFAAESLGSGSCWRALAIWQRPFRRQRETSVFWKSS